MKPFAITDFIHEVEGVLRVNGLGNLMEHLANEKLMKVALREHFNQLDREDKPIPVELDWIYSQYHNVVLTRIVKLPNQCTDYERN